MDSNQSQVIFFNHIKSKLPAHLSLVDEVAELLNISNDSAYRRIRGEKQIGMDELQILCNKYKVSLDQLLQIQTNTVIFSGNKVDNVIFDFKKYLQDVASNLGLFKMLQDPRIYFYNKDIPLFHYMQFPELSAFKFFFWKRTLIGYPELSKQQFTGEEPDKETAEIARNIIQLYDQVPSTEIWNEESVHITIRQIEFYRQSSVFANKQVLLKVYLQLEELLNHIELQAEAGKKFLYNQQPAVDAASFDVYINECLIGDNTIYVRGAGRQITFLNHNGLNFIGTQDEGFCDYTFKNIQNIMKKSTHISVVGEKERSMFFNVLREKIYERKKNIN
ncbi:MAG TPA: helix-turn-helix transcriptional regulator [Ferruginibacter sp.]|nr:helix-turn-helix transcriptional regulator [Ferruginibacter sp.]